MRREKGTGKGLRALLAALTIGVMTLSGLSTGARAGDVTPRLAVIGAETEGGTVTAGDTFDLTIHLRNESAQVSLVNIMLKLSGPDNQIVTASGSDTVYIESIPAGSDCDVTVTLKADEKLTDKAYALNLSYFYENTRQTPYSDTATVFVNVRSAPRPLRLNASEIKLTRTKIYVEGKTSLSMKLTNLGRGKIYNVSVAFTGESIDDITACVGAIEAGKSSTLDLSLTGRKGGEEGVTATITYEDEAGRAETLQERIPLRVLEYEEAEDDAEAGRSTCLLALILGAALFILGGGMRLASIQRRRKEKKDE